VGDISEVVLRESFGRLLRNFVEESQPRYSLAQIRNILKVNDGQLYALKEYIEKNSLATSATRKTATCGNCKGVTTLLEPAKGICRCDNGHITQLDPESFLMFDISEENVLHFLQKITLEQVDVEVPAPDIEAVLPFHDSGFGFVGRTSTDDLTVAILLPLKRVELREAAALLGLR
jgi:hypothetical protein